MFNVKQLLSTAVAAVLIGGAYQVDAATIFETNTSGNAAALQGAGNGDTTPLPLDASDGGGTINLTTVDVSGNNTLGMDGDSMGHGNDKWGANQQWTFEFDQPISFDAISMFTFNETMILQSDAWIGSADTTGSGWTFDGTTGTFDLLSNAGSTFTFDFTGAGVPDVAAGTDITFGHPASASGGEQMASFTITVIPEPGSLALLGLGGLLVGYRRRRD